MGLVHSIENYYGAEKTGDVEIQRAGLVDDLKGMLRECWQEAKKNEISITSSRGGRKLATAVRGLAFNGYRYEIVEDGAGVRHYNLYTYWTDPNAQAKLDPRNLNGAQQAVFGQTLDQAQLSQLTIGAKEGRF